MSFHKFQSWVDAHGFPSRSAKPKSEEKRLAFWWNDNTKASGFAKLDSAQQAAIDGMRPRAPAPRAVATPLAEWHDRCDKLEQWISAHDKKLPKQYSDVVEDTHATWLAEQKRNLKQLSKEQQLRLAPILELQARVKRKDIAEVPVMRRSTRASHADSGDAVSVSQELDDALLDAPDLSMSFARKGTRPPTGNASKSVSTIAKHSYDTSKCMARTTGKKQCQRKRARNSDFCDQHRKSAALGTLPHGRCDNPLLADGAPTKSTRLRGDKTKTNPVFYCRQTMWSYAAKLGVEDLADLSDEQYDTCLKETHEYLRKHPSYVTSW